MTQEDNFNDDLKTKFQEKMEQRRERLRGGRVFAGLFLVLVGGVLMARQAGADLPYWLFNWQMILIAIGLFIGAKHKFRGGGWLVPVLIGTFFLLSETLDLSIKVYMWPAAIIGIGLFMIFRKKSDWREHKDWYKNNPEYQKWGKYEPYERDEDRIDITAIFGSSKKIVLTKTFKGGDVTSVFGGSEVNLMQADFQGKIKLDCTQIFGGAKLLIPAHWTIKSEMTAIFGSVEDNRPMSNVTPDPDKVIILDGTCLFGGLEIHSY